GWRRTCSAVPSRALLTTLVSPLNLPEVREAPELAAALLDLAPGQRLQALDAEGLHREAGDGAAVDHRLLQRQRRHRFGLRQVADEAAGEAVACTGWIVNLLQRVGRCSEVVVLGEEHDAVFALLHQHAPRPEGEDLPRRRDDAAGAG